MCKHGNYVLMNMEVEVDKCLVPLIETLQGLFTAVLISFKATLHPPVSSSIPPTHIDNVFFPSPSST